MDKGGRVAVRLVDAAAAAARCVLAARAALVVAVDEERLAGLDFEVAEIGPGDAEEELGLSVMAAAALDSLVAVVVRLPNVLVER